MDSQHLSIEGYWDVDVLYDVCPQDLGEVERRLMMLGAPEQYINDAVVNLSGWDAGYTFTTFGQRTSLVCIGRAETLREFLNTVDHEIDHVQDHVASYYGVTLGTEEAAYLQGYIGGRLFEFIIKKMLNQRT